LEYYKDNISKMKAKDKRKQTKQGPQSDWDKNQKEIIKEEKKKKSEKL